MTAAEEELWLLDTRRNPYRALLIELDHSAGTVYLASQSWLSDSFIAYDDCMTSDPEIRDDLYNFLGVGDVDAINRDDSVSWISYNWRGYPCRWYFGDTSWPKSKFRQIASTLIDGCRVVDGRVHRFDLMDGGQHLKRKFLLAERTNINSAKSTIAEIMTDAGLPAVTFINVPDETRDFRIRIEMTTDSVLENVLRKIIDSLGAFMRVNQTGGVEIFVPEKPTTPDITLVEDDIAYGGIKMVEAIPAYKKVTILYSDGTGLSGTTTANTGELNEEKRIDTVLRSDFSTGVTGAETLRDERVAYHSNPHFVYEVPVFDRAGLLEKGSYVGVDHPELTGVGLITSIKRSPLAFFSQVEIEI